MNRINHFAVVAAVVAAFVASSLWYSPVLFGTKFIELSGFSRSAGPNIVKVTGELLRTLILAYVLARLLALLNVVDWKDALSLGAWLWIGFPVVLPSGSVMWQNVPWMLAAIHAGDWLVKIILIAVILGVWRKVDAAPLPQSRSATSALRNCGPSERGKAARFERRTLRYLLRPDESPT